MLLCVALVICLLSKVLKDGKQANNYVALSEGSNVVSGMITIRYLNKPDKPDTPRLRDRRGGNIPRLTNIYTTFGVTDLQATPERSLEG